MTEPTRANEMREKRARGIEITLLEYGDVVSIRPMDATFFLRTGKVPDFLSSTVQRIIRDEKYERAVPPVEDDPEKITEWLKWLDELIKWAFVSPKVVDNPREDTDEIGIGEISYQDKLHIYGLFGLPAQILRRFRQQPAGDVAVVDAAKNNGKVTEPIPEHSALGA